MRKEKIITRTIRSAAVKVMGINSENTVEVRDVSMSVQGSDQEYFTNAINICTPDGFSPARVISVKIVEELYGMPESTFLAHAVKLPPRKNYDESEEESEEG